MLAEKLPNYFDYCAALALPTQYIPDKGVIISNYEIFGAIKSKEIRANGAPCPGGYLCVDQRFLSLAMLELLHVFVASSMSLYKPLH